MSTIIPTIGRQVWFWKSGAHRPSGDVTLADQPEAATVVYVHDDRLVNLQVIDHNGHPRPIAEVQLRQPDDAIPATQFCEWIPYQVKVAGSAP